MCRWGESATVTLKTPQRGKLSVEVDRCIAPLVQALNDSGIETIASCCGHGRINGTIALRDGRWIEIWPDDAAFRAGSQTMHSPIDIHGKRLDRPGVDSVTQTLYSCVMPAADNRPAVESIGR